MISSASSPEAWAPLSPWARALGEVFGQREEDEAAIDPVALAAAAAAPLVAPPMPLAEFVARAWHVVEPGTRFVESWHVEAVCLHLEALTRALALVRLQEAAETGEVIDPWWAQPAIRKLIINIPPGHMKSLLTCVFWPAWVWSFRPEWRAIFSSYDDALVIRDSTRCRAVINSEWYRRAIAPTWQLAGDQNVKGYFRNTRMGERKSLTVAGGATGFRGDAVVVDDPLNVKDRFNDERRKKVLDWWRSAMSNRVNDLRTGVHLVMGQRLHESDLAGSMIRSGGYELLCLPSEFEPKRRTATAIGWRDPREDEGELLFPTMYTAEVLEQAKSDLGTDGFAAQHQQRPNSAAGGIFKRAWWKFYETMPPKFHELLASWDMTFKDTDGSDYVVGQVWGRVHADCYLIDQVRARLDFPNTLRAVRCLAKKWPRAAAKLVEDKANGPAVIATLKREIPGLIAIEPDGGKIVRAHAVSPIIESGNVWLPGRTIAAQRAAEWAREAAEPGSWLARKYVSDRLTMNDALDVEFVGWVHDYIEEHAAMSSQGATGDNDDQVDATTQALRRIYQPVRATRERRGERSGAASAIEAME